MAKKPRPRVDVFAEALIREQEERQIRDWLAQFRGLQHHEKVWVMVGLLRKARADRDSVGIVREVVKRGNLLDVLMDARTRMIRMGELKMNPVLAELPVGATFWRAGKRFQVTGEPRTWGRGVLVPVTQIPDGMGTLPGFLQVQRRKLLPFLGNPRRQR